MWKKFIKALTLNYSLNEVAKICKKSKSTIHSTLFNENFKKEYLIKKGRLWESFPKPLIISNTFSWDDKGLLEYAQFLLKKALFHKSQNISFFSNPYLNEEQ